MLTMSEGLHNKKVTAISARKPIKRKPKDKPKRPLSAYNFFFKEERIKVIKAVNCEEGVDPKDIDPELTDELIQNLRKDDGKVSFEEMGKLIGHRWKEINSERLAHYSALAQSDTERYKKEMETYNERREEIRNEAKRSAVPEIHYSPHAHGRAMMPPHMQRYPDMPGPPHAGMYGGHGGFLPYHIDPNAPPGYGQPPMMPYNPYYMPPPDGQYGSGAPPSYQGENGVSSGPPNGSPYGYPPPQQGEHAYSSDLRPGHYPYPQMHSQAPEPAPYPQQAPLSSEQQNDSW